MTTFGGATIPPLFGGSNILTVVVPIDNSAVQGILSFGIWAFPMAAVCTRGHVQCWKRDGTGDTLIFDDVYDATASLVYVNYVGRQGGVNFDLGSTEGYTDAGTPGFPVPPCSSVCNHGRWVSNAGVPRTVQRTTRIQITPGVIPGACPGSSIFFAKGYDITAVFSG